uniref:BZIP domain-containing protein n=1 Tax=Haemonchus contortus TaxID=6289 RepID=A0A7I4YRS5_HAECO
MSRHPYDKQQRPSCSYQPRFTQPSPADSSCSSTLAPPLTSPIGNPAIGNRLNPLAQPGFGYPRGPLQYDLNPQYMGGARKSGGRRPKEFEMGPEIEDQDELDKRIKRRQRNKEAAARCRQRRLDLMTNLQEQVDKFKAENEKKEMEIRAMKSQMEQMHSFLRSHDCKMSVEEREALPLLNMPSIRSTMPPIMNGITSNPHPITDYRTNVAEVNRKRVLPAPQLPAHSDASFLEPDMKCPKIEKDVSLADLNAETISRPNHINFDMIGLGNTNIPLSTPTNITYTTGTTPYTTAGTYSAGFPGWFHSTTQCNGFRRSSEVSSQYRLNNDFLNDSTGLTPCTQPNPIFVNTPTPLQTSEADLRAL